MSISSSDFFRYHIDKPHKQNQSQHDCTSFFPGILIHGKNKGRSDSACAYQTENGSFTDVYIKPVEDDRGENRLQLWQDTVADGGKRTDPHGQQRMIGTRVQGI